MTATGLAMPCAPTAKWPIEVKIGGEFQHRAMNPEFQDHRNISHDGKRPKTIRLKRIEDVRRGETN